MEMAAYYGMELLGKRVCVCWTEAGLMGGGVMRLPSSEMRPAEFLQEV